MELFDRIRRRAEKRHEEMDRKIHPALPIILRHHAQATKADKALGRNPLPERVEEIQSRWSQELNKALESHLPLPTSLYDVVYAMPVERFVSFQYLHFRRHGTAAALDMQLASANDHRAWKRLQRTEQDYAALACGKGPVKASKSDATHSDIFLFGIGLGLEKLGEEELADFFDAHCWCGKVHEGNALKKQYKRMVRKFSAAAARVGVSKTIRSTAAR